MGPLPFATATILALVVAGCAVVTPSPNPSVESKPAMLPSPSELATEAAPTDALPAPSPLAAATAPAGLERIGEVERDGVRLTLALDSTPLGSRADIWATMTVENLGADSAFFVTDGCEVPVQLGVRLGGEWIGGAQQLGVAGEFKRLVMFGDRSGHGRLDMGFLPEQRLSRESGCADTRIPQELEAGAKLTQRSLWAPWDDAPVPSLPVSLEASFPFTGRGRPGAEMEPVIVSLDSWVIGGEPWPWMTPAQAVDAALADPQFFAWLLEAPPRTWINAYLDLDTEAGIWQVGLFRDASGRSWAKMIQLDAVSGRVIPPVETNIRPSWRQNR